jgi:protein-S-isoprenylcysteine O-methyltransferase Ste14
MTTTSSVHVTLARSYLVYFICSIVGLFADTFIGFTIYIQQASQIAVVCFAIGSLLIAWAQYTSRHGIKESQEGEPVTTYFYRGPYRYLRNPTHLGILLLVTGYTIVSGSLLFFGVTVIGYLISNIFFHRYEAILDRTYGDTHKEYKTNVPKIF